MNSRRLTASNFVCICRKVRETQTISYLSAVSSFLEDVSKVSLAKASLERRQGRDELMKLLSTCWKKRLRFTFSFVSAQQRLNGKNAIESCYLY